MSGGELLYRCRMCGETFDHFHVPDVLVAAIQILMAPDHVLRVRGCGFFPSMWDTHYHDDGTVGVADFIGYRKDKEEPRP